MKGIQNTSTENFSTIIGNNRHFYVPKFQRDYSWDVEQWDDLWTDLMNALTNDDEHYMGYLVLQTQNDKDFYIIDGQQRFTTITLMILSTLRCIQNFINQGVDIEDNELRIKNFRNLYIGKVDPVSLSYDNILILNRNNEAFFSDYLVSLEQLPVRGLTATEKLMKKCSEFFEKKISLEFSTGKECAAFIQQAVEKLYFTIIEVTDELNAFKVFETLNARGVQLSSSDLLKNYLFSLVDNAKKHESHINILERRWAKLTDNIKSEKLPEFLRYYWNSKHKSIRSNEVFKTIRAEVTSDSQVFAIVNEMLKYSDVYMALLNPDDDSWEDSEVKGLIDQLNLFRLKQPISALMAAKVFTTNEDFKRLLKRIINICFRYNVICDKNPNDQDLPFNQLAISISENHAVDFRILDKITVSDVEFEKSFESKIIPYNSRNAKIIRYILGKIEKVYGASYDVDFHDEDASIEHVLPQQFEDNWSINEENALKYVFRLGNCVLLERAYNREIENKVYLEKVTVFNKSRFLMTRELENNYPEWNEKTIERRQKKMASLAKGIWRIN